MKLCLQCEHPDEIATQQQEHNDISLYLYVDVHITDISDYVVMSYVMLPVWNQALMIEGDFNLVQNMPLILNHRAGENEKFKANMDLTDIWRDLHRNIQRFTWRRNIPAI